jgi:RNA recognition motif-containing protein
MNIYVGNLPKHVTKQDVQELFEAHGKVATVSLITDKFTGESRGLAFVEMPDNDEAVKAINSLNGKEFEGSNLTVNEARPREARPAGGSRGGGSRGGGYGGGFGGGGRRGGGYESAGSGMRERKRGFRFSW